MRTLNLNYVCITLGLISKLIFNKLHKQCKQQTDQFSLFSDTGVDTLHEANTEFCFH
jgi:hypothetical protein